MGFLEPNEREYSDQSPDKHDAIVYLKPLSVNVCWQGRRHKTQKYKAYEKHVLSELPDTLELPTKGNLMIYIRFAHSNRAFDYDNGIKPFQDILQKKYGFDDKRIYFAIIEKVIVPKGDEYVYFRMLKMGDTEELRGHIKEIFG